MNKVFMFFVGMLVLFGTQSILAHTHNGDGIRIIDPKTIDFFQPLIAKLPDACVPISGVDSFVFQGENQQAIFMAFHKRTVVAPHSHVEQMGIVLKGRLELTIHPKIGSPKTVSYCKGDIYRIPKGVIHSATIIPDADNRYMDLTIFNKRDRYGNGLPIPSIPELVKTVPLQINPKIRTFFPDFITKLPDAYVGLGSDSFLIQGKNQQAVFIAFYNKATISPHSHKAQTGIILKGRLSLTVHSKDGSSKTTLYQPGDLYYIPEKVVHSATNIPDENEGVYLDFTLFDQRNRYGKFK